MAKDHNAKNCQQRVTCRICVASHPTILHGFVPKVNKNNNQSIANPDLFTKECSWRRKCDMCISKWQV